MAVGGYDGRMATEDIDLTWRLLIAGWQTAYEPRAAGRHAGARRACPRCGRSASAGRAGRERSCTLTCARSAAGATTACGCWACESLASLIWVFCLLCSLVLTVLNLLFGQHLGLFGVGLAWGVAISVVATLQLIVAVALRHPYDRWGVRAMLLGPIYPLLFWIVSASAAVTNSSRR